MTPEQEIRGAALNAVCSEYPNSELTWDEFKALVTKYENFIAHGEWRKTEDE